MKKNLLNGVCIVNFIIGTSLLAVFGPGGIKLMAAIAILAIACGAMILLNKKIFSFSAKSVSHVLAKKPLTESEIASKKLRIGMLWWQIVTTTQFVGYFLLLRYWGAMKETEAIMLFWGAYAFFTIVHAVFFACWNVIIPQSYEEAERREKEKKLRLKMVEDERRELKKFRKEVFIYKRPNPKIRFFPVYAGNNG